MFYLQIATAIISLLLGLTQITKESSPIVKKIQENKHQVDLQKQQQNAVKKAVEISQMQISWQYRGNDGVWRYYSDPNGRFWSRVNIQGVYEYCELPNHNPNHRIASNPVSYH